jgi:hypothetical protein
MPQCARCVACLSVRVELRVDCVACTLRCRALRTLNPKPETHCAGKCKGTADRRRRRTSSFQWWGRSRHETKFRSRRQHLIPKS